MSHLLLKGGERVVMAEAGEAEEGAAAVRDGADKYYYYYSLLVVHHRAPKENLIIVNLLLHLKNLVKVLTLRKCIRVTGSLCAPHRGGSYETQSFHLLRS
jgi:hypothetical protein